ncbi:glucose 1-dehydrogenase [Myroides sp. LJL119]
MIYEELLGRTVVVTGASSGIGKDIALRLAQQGMNVVVNYYKNEKQAQEVVTQILNNKGKAIAVYGDVSKQKDLQELLNQTLKEFKNLDLWINNAGLQIQSASHLVELSDWQKVIDTNLTGVFVGCQLAIDYFLKQKKVGNIINISSVHQQIPRSQFASYATSKAAVEMLSKTLALEYAPNNIRINCVAPGAIQTPINTDFNDKKIVEAVLAKIPMRRIGQVQDVSNLVSFLASDQSLYITGTTMYVDGGMTLYPSFTSDKTS